MPRHTHYLDNTMNRRAFVKNTVVAGAAAAATGGSVLASSKPDGEKFQMKYAPHLGMFKHSAGDDPIDQLNFMADMGFTAFEDNGMKGRPIDLQEKMAGTMAKRGLEMGVFVAHKIYWKEANLASGKKICGTSFSNISSNLLRSLSG